MILTARNLEKRNIDKIHVEKNHAKWEIANRSATLGDIFIRLFKWIPGVTRFSGWSSSIYKCYSWAGNW